MAVAFAVQVRAALKWGSEAPKGSRAAVIKVGDIVVTMSYPGLFTVVAIDGETVTLGGADGRTIVVQQANLRRLERPASDAS